MSKTNNNGHVALFIKIATMVIIVVGAFATWASAKFDGQDARIRDNSVRAAATRQWQEDVTRRLGRIEQKLDKE